MKIGGGKFRNDGDNNEDVMGIWTNKHGGHTFMKTGCFHPLRNYESDREWSFQIGSQPNNWNPKLPGLMILIMASPFLLALVPPIKNPLRFETNLPAVSLDFIYLQVVRPKKNWCEQLTNHVWSISKWAIEPYPFPSHYTSWLKTVSLLWAAINLQGYFELYNWWLSHPVEKYEFVKLDHHPNYWGKNNVPNHHPVYINISLFQSL